MRAKTTKSCRRVDMEKSAETHNMTPVKWVVSVFICLNLLTVLHMNRPIPVIDAGTRWTSQYLSKNVTSGLYYVSWLIQRYAHLVGLDNRWQMFGRQSRFNWWYRILGKFGSKLVLLPLPLQSSRNTLESMFIDFKEIKFQLNLYPSEAERRKYAHYLCRQFAGYRSMPIESVIFQIYGQKLKSRQEASSSGDYVWPKIHEHLLNEFPCGPFNTPAGGGR